MVDIPLTGAVDPKRLLADRVADRVDRLLPGLDSQPDPATRDAYLGMLVGLTATVEALRAPLSPHRAAHLELAVRLLSDLQTP